MSYIREIEGDSPIYPYALQRLPRDFPNVSFMQPFEANDLLHFGVFAVEQTAQPAFNPLTQRVAEVAPVGRRQTWAVIDLTADELPAAVQKFIKPYQDAMDALFDRTAQAKQYDDRKTCALRAGYVGPFQTEGTAFAQWMDGCYALGYQIIEEVKAGQREIPSVGEFLALLPVMTWPGD